MLSNSENQRILVVDDDIYIRRLLSRILSEEGYTIETVADAQAMWRAFRTRTFNLVILDLRLPGGQNGIALAGQLRSESIVPLIMLTGKAEPIDKVIGLEVGADDYVTKPFDRHELIARIRSVLRRSRLQGRTAVDSQSTKHVIRFAGWTPNLGRRQLIAPGGTKIELTNFEFLLLSALAQKPGQLLSRDQMLEMVACRQWNPSDRSIDVHIRARRRWQKRVGTPCERGHR